MSVQPAVLQVVILRDGLLVGTEVFVAGQYALGSGAEADLKLDDPAVASTHAHVHFVNGRVAIQDAGTGALFVNGHRVNACEVRPVDEVACGPFTLKLRVLAQKGAVKAAPSADVAAVLGGPAQPEGAPPVPKPTGPSRLASVAPSVAPVAKHAATVVSSRRMSAAPQAAPAQPAASLQPVEADEVKTQHHAVDPALLAESAAEVLDALDDADGQATTKPSVPAHEPRSAPTPAPVAAPKPAAKAAPAPAPAPARPAPAAAAQARAAPVAHAPAHAPTAAPAAAHGGRGHGHRSPAKARTGPRGPVAPPIIPKTDGKGAPHLFVESYWGDIRRGARSFKRIDPKKKLLAGEDDGAAVPLWGFRLEGAPFVFAEQAGDNFRVFVPPNATVERIAQDGKFYPVQADGLEVGPGQRRCLTLSTGHAVRFTGQDEQSMVAYVQAPLPRPFANPLKNMPWLAIAMLVVFGTAFGTFAMFAHQPETADFEGKNVAPVAVRLIAPPKKEEKKKIEEKIKKLKKEEKKPEPKVEKAQPKVAPETKKALKSIEKLTAKGAAMKDLLAAVDKLGSGPGAKNAKNDFKLSGLIGKAPIANAGIGTFGLGGGGGGGMGIKGAELLRGKGGAGIGALGAGRIGKGAVSGAVTHAVSRSVGAQGAIDKEAVAKAINSHLAEVSSCYERALLKEPGLSGKIVLEWQITTSGGVGFAKTKSSSMRSAAVESCIIASLKTWKFPAAKGAGVVITYPFMFNSVGY